MAKDSNRSLLARIRATFKGRKLRQRLPPIPTTIAVSCVIGLLGGYGAVVFTFLIGLFTRWTVEPVMRLGLENRAWLLALCFVPAAGLLAVSWLTRRFAPEAEGHGVPEVILAVARKDGIIRPRVALVKILASGLCIGTGGSVGREGPIVQIGSSLGSVAGQWLDMSPRHIKVLVAAGAAAGISATFNAPLAGVIFASEIILGSFAVESLTPIVVASVIADVVQTRIGEHGQESAFRQLEYEYQGALGQLPTYFLLGLLAGLVAVGFTRLLYALEDWGKRWLPRWWLRAVVFGALVGVTGAVAGSLGRIAPPTLSEAARGRLHLPPLFGVGYPVVDHALHLESRHLAATNNNTTNLPSTERDKSSDREPELDRTVLLDRDSMLAELWWLLPLVLLKPLVTSLTLAGGGSGGIFAPSLFIGATLGASFGLICNILLPGLGANPGLYAIVGMGAVVAGTTHGVLSAILIVYEMTGDYEIILPIMAAAGLSSIVASLIDPESIYYKKLSRRGQILARGHDMHRLEHTMVRDVMLREFPTVNRSDMVPEIVRVARNHPEMESLPVMNNRGELVGIIRPEDLHRVLDTDVNPHMITAEDIAIMPPIAVTPDENMLEALRDFGTRDIEVLPVETSHGNSRKLVGLLLRADVMRRYRLELLERER